MLLDLVRGLDTLRYNPYVWTNCESLHKEVLRSGVHSELSEFNRLFVTKGSRFNLSAWLKQVRQARNMIDEFEIDLIHANSAAPCQWMTVASRLSGVPLVTQLHSDYPSFERMIYGLHMSPRVIAVSEAITKYLSKDGYPNDNISVIHNGLDIERFNHKEYLNVKHELGIPKNSYLFVTVGSLIHRKGIDRVITALRFVLLEYPDTHLLVIGQGPLKQKLEQHAECVHVEKNVHFVGEQTNVLTWLKGCDGYVSGARQEAFGLVFNEAALAELPIIAPEEGGIPEIITHKKNGLLYKNKGIGPLVNTMRAVIKNRKPAKALGVRAKANVIKNHSCEENVKRIQAVYDASIREKSTTKIRLWRTLSPIRTYISNRFAVGR
ncbi:glycosyltransferase family 4 protein [Vibrio sonorensis]|uniref:glycosyltransferase family 4 protein n=1 Tax=Vibrio sonorensis TaxID=1004316 RepID=UPI000AFB7FB1|nr:glycosyltransferase family 4 protein [Vibrio sonorensis]